MTTLSPDTQKFVELLQQAVDRTLERKRRLGHYIVVWQDGKPVAVGEDAPSSDDVAAAKQS